MNTTEDHQPLGELPDVDGLIRQTLEYAQEVGRQAVAAWAGLSTAQACDQIDRQGRALDEIREVCETNYGNTLSRHILAILKREGLT